MKCVACHQHAPAQYRQKAGKWPARGLVHRVIEQ